MSECDARFCREASLAAGVPVTASATASTSTWLLLEVRQPWEAKAYEAASLPLPVRAHMDAWLAAIPASRIQFIRRPRRETGPLRFMIAWSGQPNPGIASAELGTLEDLLDIDAPAVIAALRAGEHHPPFQRLGEPLVLVCTHGKRDPCCAKWGLPVYQALCERDGAQTWQTSHLGGHRFAATALTFPSGLHYGRLVPEDAAGVVEAEKNRRIYRPERFRGRTCLSAPEQVVDHHVRELTALWGVEDVVVETRAETPDRAEVVAQVRDGRVLSFVVRRDSSALELPGSCGKRAERATQWVLENGR